MDDVSQLENPFQQCLPRPSVSFKVGDSSSTSGWPADVWTSSCGKDQQGITPACSPGNSMRVDNSLWAPAEGSEQRDLMMYNQFCLATTIPGEELWQKVSPVTGYYWCASVMTCFHRLEEWVEKLTKRTEKWSVHVKWCKWTLSRWISNLQEMGVDMP